MPDNLTPNPHGRLTPVVLFDTTGNAKDLANSNILRAVISAAGSGDNTLVAAQASGIKIRVLAVHMQAAGAVAARFESGAGGTALTGVMSMITGVPLDLSFNPEGWIETAAATLLNLELGGAVQVSGVLLYTLVT